MIKKNKISIFLKFKLACFKLWLLCIPETGLQKQWSKLLELNKFFPTVNSRIERRLLNTPLKMRHSNSAV